MRIFHIEPGQIRESADLEALSLQGLDPQGYVWIACGRPEFESEQARVQTALHILCCLLYTSPSPRDLSTSRMPSSA